MTNTALLEEYIKKSGYRKGYLSDVLGLSRYGFLLKCNNKAEFRASEIEKLCNVLKIDTEARMNIFFAK